MPERRRVSRRVAGIVGAAVVLAAVVVGWKFGILGTHRGAGHSGVLGRTTIDATTPLADLTEALRLGDSRALVFIQQQVMSPSDARHVAVNDEQATAWAEALAAIRAGFVKFNGTGRAIAESVAFRILDQFSVEPASAKWDRILPPLHDLLTAGLADASAEVRAAALDEIGKIWAWLPGRSLTPYEENSLAGWKDALYPPVLRALGHRDARTLVAAVACLGALPIDRAAAPAVAYLENPDSDVRKQTMISFSRRNLLLTDDMLLKRLHDPEVTNRETATLILKTRGLTQEQISLGGLIFSPKPEQRISVIPFLKDRSDIDPVVWLIQLSHDPEEMVRLSAIEALAAHQSPSVRKRLDEMARGDKSVAVRQAASKVVPSERRATAALPPLPGSPGLNPKAN
jgi:HEAT repeat protein